MDAVDHTQMKDFALPPSAQERQAPRDSRSLSPTNQFPDPPGPVAGGNMRFNSTDTDGGMSTPGSVSGQQRHSSSLNWFSIKECAPADAGIDTVLPLPFVELNNLRSTQRGLHRGMGAARGGTGTTVMEVVIDNGPSRRSPQSNPFAPRQSPQSVPSTPHQSAFPPPSPVLGPDIISPITPSAVSNVQKLRRFAFKLYNRPPSVHELSLFASMLRERGPSKPNSPSTRTPTAGSNLQVVSGMAAEDHCGLALPVALVSSHADDEASDPEHSRGYLMEVYSHSFLTLLRRPEGVLPSGDSPLINDDISVFRSAKEFYRIDDLTVLSAVAYAVLRAAVRLRSLPHTFENKKYSGFTHNDLKLDNVLLDRSTGTISVCDFEFVGHLSDEGVRHNDYESKLPYSHCAPEGLGRKSDVWAFGLLVLELFVGIHPIIDGDAAVDDFGDGPLLQLHEEDAPGIDWQMNLREHVLEKCRELPEEHPLAPHLDDLLSLCLNNDPEKRPAERELLSHPFFSGMTMARSRSHTREYVATMLQVRMADSVFMMLQTIPRVSMKQIVVYKRIGSGGNQGAVVHSAQLKRLKDTEEEPTPLAPPGGKESKVTAPSASASPLPDSTSLESTPVRTLSNASLPKTGSAGDLSPLSTSNTSSSLNVTTTTKGSRIGRPENTGTPVQSFRRYIDAYADDGTPRSNPAKKDEARKDSNRQSNLHHFAIHGGDGISRSFKQLNQKRLNFHELSLIHTFFDERFIHGSALQATDSSPTTGSSSGQLPHNSSNSSLTSTSSNKSSRKFWRRNVPAPDCLCVPQILVIDDVDNCVISQKLFITGVDGFLMPRMSLSLHTLLVSSNTSASSSNVSTPRSTRSSTPPQAQRCGTPRPAPLRKQTSGPLIMQSVFRSRSDFDAIIDTEVVRTITYFVLRGLCTMRKAPHTFAGSNYAGYTHNDLKLDNVLLRKDDGSVALCDFELVGHIKQHVDKHEPYLHNKSPKVTPNSHRAPEGYGFVSDCWGVGIMVVEMLTGIHPIINGDVAVDNFGPGPLLVPAGTATEDEKVIDWKANFAAHFNSVRPDLELCEDIHHFLSCALTNDTAYRWTPEQLLDHPFVVDVNEAKGKKLVKEFVQSFESSANFVTT